MKPLAKFIGLIAILLSSTLAIATNRADTFNRADNGSSVGSPSDGLGAYTKIGGDNGQIFHDGGGPFGAFLGTGASGVQLLLDSATADGSAKIKVANLSSYSTLFIRGDGAGAGIGLTWDSGGNNLQFYRWTSTTVQVAIGSSVNPGIMVGDIVEIVASGNQLSAKVNGTQVIAPFTESSYTTNTKHGPASLFQGGSFWFRNFSWTDAGGGALSDGTLSITGHTSTSVSLSIATNTGGTSPYSNQFQQAPDVSGSPGTWAAIGSPISGATATKTATGLSSSTTYWFRVVVTDSAGSPATANSNQVSQATDAPSALVSGTPIQVCTSSAVTIYLDGSNGSTAPSGGTAPYTYQWYGSTTSNFTPGGGNILSGKTSQNLSVSAPTTTLTFYRCIVTDSQGTPATETTVEAPGRKLDADVNILIISDSRNYNTPTSGETPPATMAKIVAVLGGKLHQVTVVNPSAPGSAPADWLTTATAWPGPPTTSGANLWTHAIAQQTASGVSPTHILIQLNVNAAATSVTPTTYGSQIDSIISACNSQYPGVPVLLSYPTYGRPAGSYGGAVNATEQLYMSQVDSRVNGTTVFYGDVTSWQSSAILPNWRQDDVHPSSTGGPLMASAQLRAVELQIYPPSSGGTGQPRRPRFKLPEPTWMRSAA